MAEPSYVLLENRGLIAVTGEDAPSFLQGLISADVDKVGPARAAYAAFLTPQGKYLHDFFVAQRNETFLLDCERERAADLVRRLGIYKLRAKVAIGDADDALVVAALFGEGAREAAGLGPEAGSATVFGGGVAYVDPRLSAAGARAIVPSEDAEKVLMRAGFSAASFDEYDILRLRLGLPDGSRDMVADKTVLLEAGFDELGGVDWDKGCFLGQELTARTKHRGLIKKRLVPVAIDGPVPVPATPVMLDGREAGEMRSAREGIGLALMRLDSLEKAAAEGAEFTAGEARVVPRKPDWARF